MPNTIQELLARDSSQIIDQIGHTVTWEGTSYDCVISEPDVSIDLQEGGFMPEGDYSVKIRRAAFNNGAGPFPQNNDQITYDGDVYKITGTSHKAGSAYIKMSVAK